MTGQRFPQTPGDLPSLCRAALPVRRSLKVGQRSELRPCQVLPELLDSRDTRGLFPAPSPHTSLPRLSCRVARSVSASTTRPPLDLGGRIPLPSNAFTGEATLSLRNHQQVKTHNHSPRRARSVWRPLVLASCPRNSGPRLHSYH